MVPDLIEADKLFDAQHTKRVLLGCSVEPEFLKNNEALREDMKGFERIIARESITYRALLDAGIPAEKVMQLPDPAFSLKPNFVPLPSIFEEREMIGINLSPMVQDFALQGNAVLMAYRMLIRHILESGEEGIALVPHVIWPNSDDRIPLTQLYEEFKDTGRVVLIENRSAAALKACIAACRMFVGARTHATIAAYSSMVPTLVVGYSVKARGIAHDLFGNEDNYVLPVQSLTEPDLLVKDYCRLKENREHVHALLREKIPFVIRRAQQNAEAVMEVYRNLSGTEEKEGQ
jgi:polysaccharide pyruvyl transferase WcaK-like protein